MQSPVQNTVVVLGTGGTISGSAASPDDNLGYVAGTVGVDALVASANGPAGVAVESEQIAQLDSKDMDFATWRRLAERVAHHAARPEVAGIVITHGTDTLEETAWFLARVVAAAKPVVLTGAMRPATSREADGPGNLADAIAVASQAGRAGVVVVFAGQVHSAHDVRKVHPSRLDAFASGDAGPLGRLEGGRLASARPWPREAALGLGVLPAEGAAWPWVEIVSSAAGVDGRAVAALVDAGVDGLVVAATGNGSVHRDLAAALARAARRRPVAILRATRCLDGAVAEKGEPEAFASAGDLVPVKARVELVLRLLQARAPAAKAD
ncbi:MAG: asparaginase [Burkholderiales bacterium]|nr:asparaginase [Burkholderiales bacterium]